MISCVIRTILYKICTDQLLKKEVFGDNKDRCKSKNSLPTPNYVAKKVYYYMIINVCPFFNDVFKALIFLGGGGYGPGMRIRRKNLRACQSTNASFVSLHQLKGHERAHCSI